jgi:hypothetical protein
MSEITCPSGLRGVIRGLKVKDEQLFLDRKQAKQGHSITNLLNACWMETLDWGPYRPSDNGLHWGGAISADRIHTLIQLRVKSYGASYTFRLTCGACQEHYPWTVNLNELPVTKVSDAGVQAYRSGQPYPVALPDGRTVSCRLLTGEDEAFLAKQGFKEAHRTLAMHLARRIVEIDGKTRYRDILDLVEDMEAPVADALWNETDAVEGGVDTSFDVECPGCANLQRVVVPFDAGFLSNRKQSVSLPVEETG